ncbi:MAG: rod shape-determining protein MreC [Candidatus Pacebacteria bacterium]|nr:rod shape-determining protein MreC [Candidatus Paceibacterota bacterium]MBP9842581.1 rod shape-determining protein MreC [Candidatus Paceibacterota bacterium]
MKVHSRHNSKTNKQKRITQVFFIAIVILLLGVALPFVFTLVGRIALYPVHLTSEWIRTSSDRLPMFLRDQQKLITDIESLENELAIAVSTDLTQQRLFEENMWLRQLLSVDGKERIAAAVIARPTELPYDLMQIDRGSDDGIIEGAPVYIGADNVIGIVTHTSAHYSFVELFTTPGFSATAYISGANVMTTLEGFGGGVARVSVPQGIPLNVGNLVHVPSIDPGVFGRVEYVENRPTQPEQYGYITLPSPVSGIRYVAVASEIVTPVEPPQIEERVRRIITDALIVDTKNFNLASSTATSTATATVGSL